MSGVVSMIAQLVNQQVLHEYVALELLTLLLREPTDDSVEVAKKFMLEVGQALQELSPRGMVAAMDRFRSILTEAKGLDVRTMYLLEDMFALYRDNFAEYPMIPAELDLVNEADIITHNLDLKTRHDCQKGLDVFHYDPEWKKHEEEYADIPRDPGGV